MSPLFHAKKYSLQEKVGKLLLIHGEADQNSGTWPMQSERYFAALKGFGKLVQRVSQVSDCYLLLLNFCDHIVNLLCIMKALNLGWSYCHTKSTRTGRGSQFCTWRGSKKSGSKMCD